MSAATEWPNLLYHTRWSGIADPNIQQETQVCRTAQELFVASATNPGQC